MTASTLPSPSINGYLTFQAATLANTPTGAPFTVLCGAQRPTITDGFAVWQSLPRPLRRALSIFQGYNPVSLSCQIVFGVKPYTSWDTSDSAGQAVEAQITYLETAAGSIAAAGPPSAMRVFSYATSGGGAQNSLIPSTYQSWTWVITGIEHGTAYSNQGGYRVYQETTITLLNYLNLGPKPSFGSTTTSGGYFLTRSGKDTALKIAASTSAASPTPDQQTLAGQICKAAQNNPCKGTTIKLARKGVNYRIRDGVHVWVPSHTVN